MITYNATVCGHRICIICLVGFSSLIFSGVFGYSQVESNGDESSTDYCTWCQDEQENSQIGSNDENQDTENTTENKRVLRRNERKEKYAKKRADLDAKNEVEGFGIGIDLIEPIIQLADISSINNSFNLIFTYGYLWNFDIRIKTRNIFPARGGFLSATSLGLRMYSSRKFGSSLFLGLSTGWSATNVPWLYNGFEIDAYGGYRYLFKFRMYIEGGAGGRFKIKDDPDPLFFLALGYIL